MKICILSLWRNDADKDLGTRVDRLLFKQLYTKHDLSWLWGVGDSSDETYDTLCDIAKYSDNKTVILANSHNTGTTAHDGRLRTGHTFSVMSRHIPDCDYVLLHESDLLSPRTVVDDLLRHAHLGPVSGWPIIDIGNGPQFYDIWAYRDIKGKNFEPNQPRPKDVFEVSSFGSLWLAPRYLVANRTLHNGMAIRDLCNQWTSEGVRLWCDPSVEVIQPTEYWFPVE